MCRVKRFTDLVVMDTLPRQCENQQQSNDRDGFVVHVCVSNSFDLIFSAFNVADNLMPVFALLYNHSL